MFSQVFVCPLFGERGSVFGGRRSVLGARGSAFGRRGMSAFGGSGSLPLEGGLPLEVWGSAF